MFAAIQIDSANRVRPSDIHEINNFSFRDIDNVHAISGLEFPNHTRNLASCVGFELVHPPILENAAAPGLKRHFTCAPASTEVSEPQADLSGNRA